MSTFDLENPDPNPGDALRDEAANLLAIRYGRPFREKRAYGKKTDVSFTRRDFGKEERFFLEAKDYSKNLRRDELVHIMTDYSGILDANKPAVLIVITRNGLTSDAQEFVEEQNRLRHMTIWQLENESLGLTSYIRYLSTLFEQDDLSSYYIDGRAVKIGYENNERRRSVIAHDLYKEVTNWILDSEQRPIAILGGYGAGKSSFVKKLVARQAKAALSDPLARRPVLINLGDFARYSSLEGLLGGKFTYDFPVESFNVHHFHDLNKKGRLLVVLDGFDEMKHAMTWGDFRAQIASLNELTKGKAKIILSGRPSAFTSSEEHIHVLRGMKKSSDGYRKLPDWPEFIEYDLLEFDKKERTEFVRNYLALKIGNTRPGGWLEARATEVNQLADRDVEIFGKPVHAKILTDLAADPNVDLSKFASGVSRWGLYEIFFSSLTEREVEKDARRPIGEVSRLAFLQEVAFWLWSKRGGATHFYAHDLPDALLDSMPSGEAADAEAKKREYLTGAFLEKKAGNVFYFGHRSFAEFLVAQRMLTKPPSVAEQTVYTDIFADGVVEFLSEAPNNLEVRAWANTIAEAHGNISLEYIQYIANAYGGIHALRQALPMNSRLRLLLNAFGSKLEWSDASRKGLLKTLRTPDNKLFGMALHLLQIQNAFDVYDKARKTNSHKFGLTVGPSSQNDASFFSEIAAALLDRVFETANSSEVATGRSPIEPQYEAARALANVSLPELMSNSMGDRHLRLLGPKLDAFLSSPISAPEMRLAPRPPYGIQMLPDDARLSWSGVLAKMSKDNATKALSYFRRNNSLRGIFVRTSSQRRIGR